MNFTILFQIIGNLNFNVTFELSPYNTQDFFIFEGENSSVHFYRDNETACLYLSQNGNFELYQLDILNRIDFSWKGFEINGTEMNRVKSSGIVSITHLNAFTFLSPVLDLQSGDAVNSSLFNNTEQINDSEAVQSLNFKNVNYGYIAGILLLFGIAVELKMNLYQIINRLFSKQNNDDVIDESDYETMENLETAV